MIAPYYQDEKVTIYNADCRDVLSSLPKVDLVLTDPPYVVGAKGCGLAGDREYLKSITASRLDVGFDSDVLTGFTDWFCFCGKQQLPEMLKLVEGGSWMLLTWNKPNPTPLTNNNYLPDVEYIVHKWSKGRLFGSYADKSRFINYPVEQNDFAHPTVKPLRVIAKLIRLGSQTGDLLLDLYCGSGTTLVAAIQLGRKAIGIEIEERYCEIAAKRIEAVNAQPGLFTPEQLAETRDTEPAQSGLFATGD